MSEATPFEAMAARIAKIDAAEFAGAVVIVPPKGGDPIQFLITDPTQKPEDFWAFIKSKVEIRTVEIMESARSQDPWGQRR